MSELPKIIEHGPSQKEKLTVEMNALEKEIQDLMAHGGVSESQIWHKRARIGAIKKEIKELETKQFNMGTEKLNEMMAAQGQTLSPEQMAKIKQQGRAQ